MLSTDTGGDPDLVAFTQAKLEERGSGNNWDRFAAAVVDLNQSVRYAMFGVDGSTQFEVGSVTKPLLGHLFAVMLNQGVVTAGQKLSTLLPVTGGLGNATLAQLAQHKSGLERDPASTQWGNAWAAGGNGYDYLDTLAELCTEAQAVFNAGNVGIPRYSNVGAALLGQALAAVLATTFADVMRELVFKPFGMHHTYVPFNEADLPVDALTGSNSVTGAPVAAQPSYMMAPGGGVRSSVVDLAAWFLRKVLEGNAPGLSAAAGPTVGTEYGGAFRRAWMWTGVMPQHLDHAGSIGGFRAYVIVRRDLRRAVCTLSNTTHEAPFNGVAAYASVAHEILLNFT